MLKGDFATGDTVIVDVKEEQIEFRKGGEPIPVQMEEASSSSE
jgi:hypothetical protein